MKVYYEKNKEERKKYANKYYEENRDEVAKYREQRKDNVAEYMRAYVVDNKETLREYDREYKRNDASIEQVQKLIIFEEVKDNQIRCKYCGRWMTPTVSQVHNRLRGIDDNDRNYIYCSEECKEDCPTFNKSLYPDGFKPATSREVNPVLRQLVLKRDNYTCQKCGKFKNVRLHCHHIVPVVNSPMEANDPGNCITLCKECHKLVHRIPGCGYGELRCG